MFNSIQQRYTDPYLLESFRDFRVVFDFPLFGHGMRKWKYWRGISLFFAMFRFNPSLPSEIDSSSFSQGSRMGDTTKRLMSSPKCRSVEVINNPAKPRSNHREVNCINYKQQQQQQQQ